MVGTSEVLSTMGLMVRSRNGARSSFERDDEVSPEMKGKTRTVGYGTDYERLRHNTGINGG